jgi:type IV pilus assembly protein PilC
MAQFVCKVADTSGRVFSQVEAAQSAAEARQKLADRGLLVYAVRERPGFLPTFGDQGVVKVSPSDFLVFNQQFRTLLKAGLPILKALDLLAQRAASPRLRPLLVTVRDRVRDGALLSEACDELGLFPKVYTASLLAGERSGNMVGVLDAYIAYQQVTLNFRKRLRASLIYPAFLIVTASLILTGITTFVIPEFSRLFREMRVPLPVITQVLIGAAMDFRKPILLGAGLLIILATSLAAWSRTDAGGLALDRVKLRLPLFGRTWVKFQIAQFCRTLSTLLMGGIPLVTAMDTAAGSTTSRLMTTAIKEAVARVREGQALHQGLKEVGFVPDLALEMVEVGEATGALGPMLTSVAEFYEEDVNIRMAETLAWVEPLILVGMGVVVAFILLALYLPVFTFGAGASLAR